MGNYPALININVLISNNGDVVNLKLRGHLISKPVAGSSGDVIIRSAKLPREIKLSCSVAEENLFKGYIWVVFETIDPDFFLDIRTPEQFSELIMDLLITAGWEDCRDDENSS